MMKELIETIVKDNDFFIDNLGLKLEMIFYPDVCWTYKNTPKIFKNIANELTNKILNFEYPKNAQSDYHPFISASESLANKLGFNSVTICPYKGKIYESLLNSNYMIMGSDIMNFTIDIYDVQNLNKKEINKLIITELFNAQRDLGWISKGIYESNINKIQMLGNNFFGMVGEA